MTSDHGEDLAYDIAEPRADSMMQSMRAFGYDLQTAVADLIDNSIAAGATHVWLDCHWDGETSRIAIMDDGEGMSAADLVNAMRPGSRSPLEQRNPKDLGRFGLGLKTASFSQCRRLTVGSKAQGAALAVRCWDLDYVTRVKEWRLLREGSGAFREYFSLLGDKPSGTVVVWEVLDRITAHTDAENSEHQAVFLERVEAMKRHVAMVFHRFLEGPRGLRIEINGQPIKPWDPFLSREPATQLLAEEAVALFGLRLDVRPYVLPHHSKMRAEAQREGAGPRGWNAQQGFYVYRNKRLLVAGDWLGLGFPKEAHYRLARILLDIPNSMDAEWAIDVKKARACPPPAIRRDLRRLAMLTRSKACEVYRHRGARIYQGPVEITFLWEPHVRHGKTFYHINRDHPLIAAIMCQGRDVGRQVKALLCLIEETVPIPTIVMDSAENPEKHAKPFENAPSELISVLRETYRVLRESGLAPAEAKIRLMALEPFGSAAELVAALDEDPGME